MIKSKYNWSELYCEFMESGLTKTAFIKRKRLPTTAYAKLEELKYEFVDESPMSTAEEVVETVCPTAPDEEAPVFIPVQVMNATELDTQPLATSTIKQSTEPSPILLEKDGYCLKVYRDFDSVTLLRIMEVMKQCCE